MWECELIELGFFHFGGFGVFFSALLSAPEKAQKTNYLNSSFGMKWGF